MDITGPNVYAGLAGYYLLTDDLEDQLVRGRVIPDADHELPLVLQDRRFDARGSLVFDPRGSEGRRDVGSAHTPRPLSHFSCFPFSTPLCGPYAHFPSISLPLCVRTISTGPRSA